jgi:lysyl-tRNA synthetase class 1
LQIQEGDLEKSKQYYQDQIHNAVDEERFFRRAKRAWKWITEYAPAEFRFTLQLNPQSKTQFPKAMTELIHTLREGTHNQNEESLANKTWEIMKAHGIDGKAFFKDVYQILVAKPNGPKLASFLIAIGPQRAADILEKSLPQ